MTIVDEVEKANAAYAAKFKKGDLALPPARKFAVLVCMDARIDPAKALGLEEGDTHVIRNAGGRASDDAIRSLIISHKLLGTQEFFVIHHTGCGMELFDGPVISGLLEKSLDSVAITDKGFVDVGKGPGSKEGHYIQWLNITDLDQSVRDDVARVRNHALIPSDIPVHGYVYDVKTGKIRRVE